MFKRANKLTALLVAAAAVVSLVPASAANAAERLGTKEGTINRAIAFDGGKYIYDGYRTDDDTSGIYYNAGEKDKLVDDLDDYNLDENSKYGSKYAYAVKSGNDDYLIDLSKGKTTDEESAEQKRDTAQSKLRSALKKTDRYENTNGWDDVEVKDITNLKGQFGDVWYQYSAKGDIATTSAAAATKLEINLPSNAEIAFETEKAKNTKKDYTITIAGDKYTHSTTASAAELTFVKNEDLYDSVQDKVKTYLDENFYSKDKDNNKIPLFEETSTGGKLVFETAKGTVLDDEGVAKLTRKYGAGTVTNGKEDGYNLKYTGFVNENGKYIDASNLANIYVYSNKSKKIVKVEEFDKENKDDAVEVKLNSLTVLTQDKDYIYAVADVKITGTAAGVEDAKYLQKISKAQGEKKEKAYIPKSVASYQLDDKKLFDNGDVNDAYTAVLKDDDGYTVEDNQYRVKDNTLYVTRVKEDKVKIFKLKLTKIKENSVNKITDKKLDGYVVKKDGDADHDIVKKGKQAISIDVDGNTWALDKGSIMKYDGKDWKEMYSCDRSLDALDVYNQGSLVAYEKEGDVYTTVQEGKAETDKDATPAQTGWVKTDAGWTFYDGAGKQVIGNNKWVNPGGVWYMIKADGIMATGWFNDNGTWYFLDTTSGAMKTGWFNDNGTWYYLQSSGAMKTGWFNVDGSWYYLNANGSMAANTTVDGYTLGANGAWVK